MKKLLILFIGLTFASANLFAEDVVADPVSCWAFPAVYDMDEEVTFYFDLSAGGFSETEDVYWWVWQPSEPDTGNWEHSSEFAKLEYDGDLVWKKTLIPTEYFKMSKEDILAYAEATFWFRLKDLTGTKGTPTAKIVYPDKTVADILDGNMWAAFPADFSALNPVAIFFDANQASGFTAGEDVFLNTYINNPDGDDLDFSHATAGAEKTLMKYLGNGIYRKDIAPKQYYGIDSEYEFKYIKGSATNGSATSDEFSFNATSLDPGTPMVYLFPSSPLFDDIIVINRVNPAKGEDPITYTITSSGFPTITGTLVNYPNTGSDKNRSIYLYLPEHWDTAPTGEIRIRLTGANNNRFFDQRFKLKTEE